MAFRETYRRQAALLVRILPLIAEESCFALKGGTAINLFVRDMPRLSVDIDLTYVPVELRDKSLKAIDAAMKRIVERVKRAIPNAHIAASGAEGAITRFVVREGGVQTRTEVTPVLRGCVYEPETRPVSETVEDTFGFAEMPVVSFADLYAGKIVAAFDRQHPRDLFDVRDLLANEGVDDALRKAFTVYLISHDRPMAEVLAPTRKDISGEYARGFDGMTEEPVPLDDLITAREAIIAEVVGKMPKAHKEFLISFEKGEPNWELLGVPGAADLPAVKWRQKNLEKLPKEKRDQLVEALKKVLGE